MGATSKTVDVSTLTGPALDWAVARALGKRPSMFIFQRDGKLAIEHNYSTDWAQGGPIIERERIDVFSIANGKGWCAQSDVRVFNGYGPTPIIAAMRCYVASKLGPTVEIPEELLS